MNRKSVPYLKVEIGEGLYLVIMNVIYKPGEPAKLNGAPEDCYPGTDPEVDWSNRDVQLCFKKTKKDFLGTDSSGVHVYKEVESSHFYEAPQGFADHYYDLILERTEEVLEED